MSHMTESRRTWRSHRGSHSHPIWRRDSCLIWGSHGGIHVLYEGVMSHGKKSHVAHEGAISHMKYMWESHVSYAVYMRESCLIWRIHVAHDRVINLESPLTEWFMSHMHESCLIWMSHVSYEWVMSHMNESCLIWMILVRYEGVVSHMNKARHI